MKLPMNPDAPVTNIFINIYKIAILRCKDTLICTHGKGKRSFFQERRSYHPVFWDDMTFWGLKCCDLSIVLTHAHSGFYDVYHIVAEFLAFLYDIHVHRADGVGVEVVVHVVDVLALQLVSVVVDFVLYVE